MKKKISIILPNLVGGGAERLAIYLALDWKRRGYLVEFILMEERGELLELLEEEGISIIELKVNKIRSAFFPLIKALKASCPDIIWVGLWPLTSIAIASWIFSGRKGKLFTIDHNHLSISTIKQLDVSPIFLKLVMRITYPFATGVMTVSHGAKKDLEKLGSFKRDWVKVIYNPAATGKASKYKITKDMEIKLWGEDVSYKIVSAGAFSHQKNYSLLLASFARINQVEDSKLIILGEGSLRTELEDQINSLGLNDKVLLPGFVKEPYPWFLTADLFVLSSDWEGLPTVLIEALECGLPIVSTDCPSGPSEILEDGKYGTLVPIGDSGLLTDAIEKNLMNIQDPKILSTRSKDFSINKISREYLDYFGLTH